MSHVKTILWRATHEPCFQIPKHPHMVGEVFSLLTFQGKYPASKSIYNGQQRHLIRHIEEVVS